MHLLNYLPSELVLVPYSNGTNPGNTSSLLLNIYDPKAVLSHYLVT